MAKGLVVHKEIYTELLNKVKGVTTKRKLRHPEIARVLCSNVSTVFLTSINPHLNLNMNP